MRDLSYLRTLLAVIGVPACAGLAALIGCERAPNSAGAPTTATSGSPSQPETGAASTDAPKAGGVSLPTPDISKFPSPVRSTFEQWRAQLMANPKNADLLVNLGAICYVHGSINDAIPYFQRAVEQIPEHEVGHYYLALSYDKAGQSEKAIKEYEAAIHYNDQAAPAYARIGNLLMEKDPEQARKCYEQVIKILPGDARAHYALGKLSRAAGKNEEALTHLRRAIELYPVYVDAHKEASAAARALGQTADADDHDKRAAGGGRIPPIIDPLFGKLLEGGMDLAMLIQLGVVATEQRDFAAAEDRLMKAMAMDTGINARVALAGLRVRQGKLDEAASIGRALLDANPESAPANDLMAEILMAQRKNDEALACAKKAQSIDANDVRAHFLVGTILRRMGDRAGSKAAFEKVVEILPSYADGYEALVAFAIEAKNYAEIERILRAGLDRSANAAKLANALAWQLATCPDKARRNGEEAVRWALTACEVVQYRSHEFCDTLGAAFAEAGKFDDALRAAQDAIRVAKEAPAKTPAEKDALAKIIAEYEGRAKLYESKQPYHEAP